MQMDGWLLTLCLAMYMAWLMLLSIFLGLMAVDPDTCSLILVAGTSLCSFVAWVFLPYFSNVTYIPPVPPAWLYVMAYLMPPFNFAMIITCGMYFTSIGEPLNFSSALANTPFGCTTAGLIVALATGIAVTAVINYYLIKKTKGIASANKSNDHEEMRFSMADNLRDLENHPEIAVSVRGLSKHFIRNDGTTNKAVDGLTVDFYEGQITSFLGHNGAGKSTAISLLTGLFLPDSGDAYIRGHSVKNDMISIRPLIGVCPQTNILWDLLSCRDHMELFARIRNIPDAESKIEIDSLLRDIGLLDKADTYAKDLSGGQKRKLQTVIALIGDPKIVFLDEPTAGMDSSARRDMWDLLLKKKAGKAIILCTHQMDEADILGDRVAVVSAGHLQEAGTPAFLKAKWGRGVRLDMTVTDGTDRNAIMAAMREGSGGSDIKLDMSEYSEDVEEQQVAEKQILSATTAADLHVFVPLDANIAGVLDSLEKYRAAGRVEDFGVTAPNLEDVFWELGKKAEMERGVVTKAVLPTNVTMVPPTSAERVGIMLKRQASGFYRDIGKQFRNYMYVFLNLAVALFIVSIKYSYTSASAGVLPLTASAFKNVEQPLAVAFDGGALPEDNMILAMNSLAATSSAIPRALNATGVSPCLQAWLLDTSQINICPNSVTSPLASSSSPNQGQKPNQPGYVGAYQFVTQTSDQYQYTVIANQSISFGIIGLISNANSAIWAAHSPTTAKTLSLSYNQWIAPETESEKQFTKLIIAFVVGGGGSLVFCMAMITLNSKLAMNLVNEKKMGIKQLQILMGVTRMEYLFTYCTWDLIQSLVILLKPIIVIYAIDNMFATWSFFVILFTYLCAMIPLVHLFAYTLNEPDIAYTSTYSLLSGSFIILFVVNTIYGAVGLFAPANSSSASVVVHLCMLHPTMALQQALSAVVFSKVLDYNAMAATVPADVLIGLNGATPPTALVPFCYLLGQAIVFFAIYIWVEYSSGTTWQKVGNWLNQNLFRCVWVECCYDPDSCCGRKKAAKYAKLEEDDEFVDLNQMPVTEIEDDDVRAERVECDTGLRSLEMVNRNAANNVENDAVLACGIHMEYPPSGMQRYEGTVAVKDFSLRIKKKECFALLGSNGAGKTTVMAILLKQLQLTQGNIFVNGVQILDVADSVAKTMSYCPQHNALFESLTSRECLEFYCRIRGVPEEKLPVYVQQWLEASDLKDHEHTWCGALSGGNKRKLSLAISLVGNPEFIVLDEPSAGVDPAARRKLHWLINATKRRGATLVLTTHHMDEASILGDRVGIMVKGYLTCLGTVQHLLHKYSNGYLLSAFMYPEYSISDELLPVLREICPNLNVGASSGTQFCSIVLGNAQEFSISKLYATMQQLQQQKKVEYFSCGQSRLEDVFLSLSDKFVRKKNPIGVAPSYPAAAGGGDLRGNTSVSSGESPDSAGLSMKNPILHSPENLTEI